MIYHNRLTDAFRSIENATASQSYAVRFLRENYLPAGDLVDLAHEACEGLGRERLATLPGMLETLAADPRVVDALGGLDITRVFLGLAITAATRAAGESN
ncbi:hypothetical protein Pan44_37390 [Caulifigura coniformis]|uniref:Uncharacterized protein n=1 Tax=Caulifigura coniformis TaxID=2527983 RepID=A0A517SHU6_9PLAN|nr:hypothetical protein [Caulifigura coniformis]QDT55693.1 hypothetical protein Pan44_37390 [Caulifigura coniformis]